MDARCVLWCGGEVTLGAALVAGQDEVEEYLTSIWDEDTRLNAFGTALEIKSTNNDAARVKELVQQCRQSNVRQALVYAIESEAIMLSHYSGAVIKMCR